METQKMDIAIRLLEPQLGTVPKDKEVYKTYIASKAREISDERGAVAIAEEVETVQDIEEKGWTGFHQDDKGVFIYDYMIRGMLKNAGNVLKGQLKIKNMRAKIDNLVFVSPRRIYFLRDDAPVKSVDGIIERPLRAMTQQGPRVTLARSDYISAGTILRFTLTIIENGEINERVIKELLAYGKFQGLGQFRNGSYGQFEVIK